MSFFHVLPSNVAPDSFPQNHASAYSTPISNDYHLNGKWEVALLNITYSGCINTFHHDQLTVEKAFDLKERLETSEDAIMLHFTGRTPRTLIDDMNKKLEGVIIFSLDAKGEFYSYKVTMDGVFAILSYPLMKRLELWNDVLSKWDSEPRNYHSLTSKKLWEDMDYRIILIPPSHPKTTITVKGENESMDRKKFVKEFNVRFKDDLRVEENEKKTRFTLHKLQDNETMVVLSPALHRMTSFRQAGMYAKQSAQYINHDFENNNFKPPWEVHLYKLNTMRSETARMSIPITLGSLSFYQRQDAVTYLNSILAPHNVVIRLSKNNVLKMQFKDDKTRIILSDTLRDILAFPHNEYSGKGVWKGNGAFSLARRIHYLYVYSNVSDYVRIGDTQAPLLAVIPFNPDVCVNLLQETTFKSPMYVPVIQNPISQIDIAIYDGAGELVPFVADAVTSLRLHFRRL